jgi:hypothetical protein
MGSDFPGTERFTIILSRLGAGGMGVLVTANGHVVLLDFDRSPPCSQVSDALRADR